MLPADGSATCSSFAMVAYPACTSISIPTTRERMKHGSAGVRIVTGDLAGMDRLRRHPCPDEWPTLAEARGDASEDKAPDMGRVRPAARRLLGHRAQTHELHEEPDPDQERCRN